MRSANNNYRYNNKCNMKEKNIIIFLLVNSLILIYFSLFFIHNITDRRAIKNTQSVAITYPSNNISNEIDNGYGNVTSIEGNTIDTEGNTTNIGGNIVNSAGDVTNIGNITGIEDNIVNNSDRFKVLQGTKEWSELKSLDIFKNSYFHDKSIIAPGVHGNYSFTVENYTEMAMEYNVDFYEENIYNVNMVYKLKLNGSYIAGNEENWVKYEHLTRRKVKNKCT